MLPGGRQSLAICCFNWLMLSWSNRICSLFLSSKLESGMSGSDIRRIITQKWDKDKHDQKVQSYDSERLILCLRHQKDTERDG